MAKRYIGDAVITLVFDERASTSSQNMYKGTISAGGKRWRFSGLGASPHDSARLAADSPLIFDRLASSIVSFAVSGHAPAATARAIEDAASWDTWDNGSLRVRRSKKGAAHTTWETPRNNPTRKRRAAKRGRARKTRR